MSILICFHSTVAIDLLTRCHSLCPQWLIELSAKIIPELIIERVQCLNNGLFIIERSIKMPAYLELLGLVEGLSLGVLAS